MSLIGLKKLWKNHPKSLFDPSNPEYQKMRQAGNKLIDKVMSEKA
jgi:hypothetical protein